MGVGVDVWVGGEVGVGEGVGVGVGEGLGVGWIVSSVIAKLYCEVKPALSTYWTYTVFCPSLPCRFQVFEVAYGSQSDQFVLSLEKRICAIPDVLSVADSAKVTVGVLV